MEEFRNVIVLGASAGGIAALSSLISGLPDDLDAAVLVVLHLSRKSNADIIITGFKKQTTLNCQVASEGAKIRKRHLYLAPPEHHIIVRNGQIHLTQGPHENKYRPSIDVLFRSAAVHYGHRTIGVVLTGLLDDGTSGMSAIKKAGGICIVQDPSDAEYGDMPQSVLNNTEVDYKVSLAMIPSIIEVLMSRPLPPEQAVPVELQIEADITQNLMSDLNQLKKIADRSDFICPDCGGGLWAVKDDPIHRYRCHTGHVYTERLLAEEQVQGIEESLWVSIRMLEERRNLLLLMRTHDDQAGNLQLAEANQGRAIEIDRHIKRLKQVLTKLVSDVRDSEQENS
ncbi:two-component system chemotaxis response regulator CheB [Arcticibacter pallidicorallinus]|uniref:protein-glutamate methylesterase n=1 Tax=Arcticibacter pallidicorallinus TaxID=1259464 RepID=A0A2T0UBE4_9SPHI|nr:chemotaxis protein CheB [Arcticibacter pallidicorallinus]PRY55233.1 two-component system chemotaxis response regulator CheB [Arcticibacter pallidicorallinus]